MKDLTTKKCEFHIQQNSSGKKFIFCKKEDGKYTKGYYEMDNNMSSRFIIIPSSFEEFQLNYNKK